MEAFVGIGSNLGDRAGQVHEASRRLARAAGVERVDLSSLYETSPVGGPPQDWFLNAVARLQGSLTPRAILEECLTIEQAMGRVRSQPNAPRTIDLDLLLVGQLVVDEPGLVVPHPALHERRFVLVPLAELAPTCRHPLLERTAAELLLAAASGDGPDVVRPFTP